MDFETILAKVHGGQSENASPDGAVGGGPVPKIDLTAGHKQAEEAALRLATAQLAHRSRSRQKSAAEKRQKPGSGGSSSATSGMYIIKYRIQKQNVSGLLKREEKVTCHFCVAPINIYSR